MARLIENGCDVHCAAFSTCEESVPAGFPKDALGREFSDSMKSLGLPDDHIHIYGYRVRRFNERRQDILADIISLRRAIDPTIVFAPSVNDIHQDHNCIAHEAIRAFKNRTIFCYEVPWNHLVFNNQFFVILKKEHVDAKVNALANYKTQSFRNYSSPDIVTAQARCRGIQSGNDFAEMFEVVRLTI